MPNYDFTSPIFLILLVIQIISISIRAYDVGILHSIREGNIVRPLGNWVGIIHWIGWASMIGLIILNWKYGLIIFGIRLILRFFGILQILGFLILYPFFTKIPSGVTNEHLEFAKSMFVVCDKSIFVGREKPQYTDLRKNNADTKEKVDYAMEKLKNLNIDTTNYKKIMEALDYLRADDFVKNEAKEFFQYEKERREREEKRLIEEKEWEEDERKSEEEFNKMMNEYSNDE